ncbi:MAG TPA: alpha-E domain-containing protein, partial [Kofleriaceae bacterium]|nr:alpha-E domain-containing protein [Kofleriaceae bacterium]
MISRVADHCFWFGRYVERAEATARMLAASSSLALDAELPAAQVWKPIVVVTGEEASFTDKLGEKWDDGEVVQR